ncbi:MAG: hypothetical protein IPG54_11105 [Sphingomonadales bacterium]|jgi:hypothetical protein|nr:hypothetical protein [Sphingomonadales bacterium]MBK9004251.1 hypothetical protein [Sphingomonadales bacterium]MBK9269428.1 hypothetical protein [Sphingomonadales bacterium]MBP6433784.1 hypothetical protein [Sphingorhabdus sp.]
MDVLASNSTLLTHGKSWDEIFAEVNAWRGACMHHFSTVEMSVTETLLALGAVKETGKKVRLRHLIGQKFEDLAAAIEPEAPFGGAGRVAHVELMQYRASHEAFRAMLCHGVAKVSVDHSGQWILLIRSLAIRARQAERNMLVMEQSEAAATLTKLKRDGQNLASVLGQLRKKVSPA